LRKATISFVVSVRPYVRLSSWSLLYRFSRNLIFENFPKKLPRKLNFHYSRTRITVTLHEDQYTFLIISRSILLRMRNVSDKSCKGNQNKHCVFNNSYFENWAVYEIIWETILETDDNMAHARCMLDN
jgi:hypothetical protein